MLRRARSLHLIVLLVVLCSCDRGGPEPLQPTTLHLTWCSDPATTIQIQWLHEERALQDHAPDTVFPPQVSLRKLSSDDWTTFTGYADDFPIVAPLTYEQYGSQPRLMRVPVTGLDPESEYEFTVSPYEVTYRFRTAPSTLIQPLRFAVSGDTHVGYDAREMYRSIARQDPLFMALGGDFGHDDGSKTDRAILWLVEWSQNMIASNKRLIPVLGAVGNHEVRGQFIDSRATKEEMRDRAPFFLSIFECQYRNASYSVHDFGDIMSLFMLDSDHISPVDGEQAEWLSYEMAARSAVPHLIPVYHVPAYPNVIALDDSHSARVRTHWPPIFEQYGVRLAFENHLHSYKRTWPLQQGLVNEASGVIYVGSGSVGSGLNTPDSVADRPYLRVSERVNSTAIVEVESFSSVRVRVINRYGQTIDSFSITR
jgi:hypothetical protein